MVEILQARLQQLSTELQASSSAENFQLFKRDLEKAEEPGIKLPTSAEASEK